MTTRDLRKLIIYGNSSAQQLIMRMRKLQMSTSAAGWEELNVEKLKDESFRDVQKRGKTLNSIFPVNNYFMDHSYRAETD